MKKLLLVLFLSFIPVLSLADDEYEVPDETIVAIAHLFSTQVRPCWQIPAGINKPLEATIAVDTQGNMKFVEFTAEIAPEEKELAESIKKAIADSKCNPVHNLPPANLYFAWSKLTLLFAPKN